MRTARNFATGAVIAGGIAVGANVVFASCEARTTCAPGTALAGYEISCEVQNDPSTCSVLEEGHHIKCTDQFFVAECDCEVGCS